MLVYTPFLFLTKKYAQIYFKKSLHQPVHQPCTARSVSAFERFEKFQSVTFLPLHFRLVHHPNLKLLSHICKAHILPFNSYRLWKTRNTSYTLDSDIFSLYIKQLLTLKAALTHSRFSLQKTFNPEKLPHLSKELHVFPQVLTVLSAICLLTLWEHQVNPYFLFFIFQHASTNTDDFSVQLLSFLKPRRCLLDSISWVPTIRSILRLV